MNPKIHFIFFSLLIGLISILGCKSKMTSTQTPVKSKETSSAPTGPLIAVGESYAGGIIFYVDSTKKHGLIASANQVLQARWGCPGKLIGGTSPAVGAGQNNTLLILEACDSVNIAARVCDRLELNGYSDWFLPSKGELDLLYKNQSPFRGMKTDYYWSSTEADGINAVCQDFYDGHRMNYEKSRLYQIRAVRAF